MKVKLWGVRGSLPTPTEPGQLRQHIGALLHKFAARQTSNPTGVSVETFLASQPDYAAGGYGGNTSCGEVNFLNTRLIIDAGSGLRNLAQSLPEDYESEFHLYFTHFHWDHIIGLPFFGPLFKSGKIVNCYAVEPDLEASVRTLFRKPNFPVPFEVVQNQLRFHRLEPRKPTRIGDLTLTPYRLDHPDPCWGARIEAGGKALAWCVDTEGTRTSADELGADAALYKNADLMVFDAQYSFGEFLERINWGHSSGPVGVDIGVREGVKLALFVHHDPNSNDEDIHRAESQTRTYFDQLIKARAQAGLSPIHLQWRFGREGEVIEL